MLACFPCRCDEAGACLPGPERSRIGRTHLMDRLAPGIHVAPPRPRVRWSILLPRPLRTYSPRCRISPESKCTDSMWKTPQLLRGRTPKGSREELWFAKLS